MHDLAEIPVKIYSPLSEWSSFLTAVTEWLHSWRRACPYDWMDHHEPSNCRVCQLQQRRGDRRGRKIVRRQLPAARVVR